jgi:hypothetical protein
MYCLAITCTVQLLLLIARMLTFVPLPSLIELNHAPPILKADRGCCDGLNKEWNGAEGDVSFQLLKMWVR